MMDAQIINYPSVSIKGAFNYSRARVLWKDGLLKVFGLDGPVLEVVSDRPVKKRGYLMAWDISTGKGKVIMRGKCITCGGKKWWRIIYMSRFDLWGSV